MKHLKTLLAALALTCASGAWAQTDVTSTYLTNADFTADTPIDNNLCGYGKDMAGKGTTYYGAQEVTGWTVEYISVDNATQEFPNSGLAGAVFEYGSEWQLMGNNKTAPATDPDGNAGQCYGFFAVWGCGFYIYQDVTLPAGTYKITVPMYNQSGAQGNTSYVGFLTAAGNKTIAVNPTVGQWVNGTVSFTLTEATEGKIAVGYKSNGSGSGANPMLFVDKVTIEWTDPMIGAKATLLEEIEKATAAKAGLADAIQTLLATDIAAAQDVYDNATTISEIVAATETLQAAETNAAAANTIYLGALSKAAEANVTIDAPTTYAEIYQLHKSIYNALRAEYTQDGSSFIPPFSSWTGDMVSHNPDEPWGPSVKNYYEQSSSDWGASSWTRYKETTVTLPVGKYAFILYSRGESATTIKAKIGDTELALACKGSTGRGVNTSGVASYDPNDEYTRSGAGYGWEADYVLFESAGEPVTIRFEGTTSTNHQWMSFNEPVLLTTADNVAFAKANLAAQIEAAQALYDAKANVGTGLFQIAETAWAQLSTDIAAAQAVYEKAAATTAEVNQAIEDLEAAVETYNAAVNTPDADKVYAVKNASSTDEKTLYLGLNKGNVTLVANKQALKFEVTEGGYYLTDGEQYVGLLGTNNWNMSAAADKKMVLNFSIADGKYTISEEKGLIGSDSFADGALCYANKGTGNNGYWTIEEVEAAAETALNEDETYAAAGTYADVTLTRTINAGWNAVVLPFAVDAADFDAETIFATYAGDETVDDVLNLKFNSVSTVAANTPFLFYAPAVMTSFTFEGILVNTNHDAIGESFDFVGFYGAETSPIVAGDYILTGGKVQKAAGGNAIKAYRAYFKAKGASAKAAQFVVDGDVVTGINAAALVEHNSNAAIYNLNGVRVSGNLQKGVYIQNGKKVVVK